MSNYEPYSWVIIKVPYKGKYVYKVLGAFAGGYPVGDVWRINSGIKSFKENTETNMIEFTGYSGSVYECQKQRESIASIMHPVLATLESYASSIISYEEFVKEFDPEVVYD